MKMEAVNYYQHIEWSQKYVEDSLIRDLHISNHKITSMIHFYYPFLTPQNWGLIPLTESIYSWVVSTGQRSFIPWEFKKVHTRSTV